MSPDFVVRMIASVAGILHARLDDQSNGNGVPSEFQLGRAIERLIAAKVIPLDARFEQLMLPGVVMILLQNLVENEGHLNGELNRAALEDAFKTCLGTLTGRGVSNPPNRRSVKPRRRDKDPETGKYHYLYYIDPSLPDLNGIDQETFRELVQAAWHRWQNAIPNLSVNATATKSRANMHINFVQLDGQGRHLAQATLRQHGTKEYQMQIDVVEDWNEAELLGTLIHEIGHTLGIDHIPIPGSIMYSDADPDLRNRDPLSIQLTDADRAAIPGMWA